MNKEVTKEEQINILWERLFALQHESCEHKLCLLDQLTYNDICDQLKQLGALKDQCFMTIERTIQGIRLSTIHKGYLVTQHYIGYTRKEAKQLFRQYLREL